VRVCVRVCVCVRVWGVWPLRAIFDTLLVSEYTHAHTHTHTHTSHAYAHTHTHEGFAFVQTAAGPCGFWPLQFVLSSPPRPACVHTLTHIHAHCPTRTHKHTHTRTHTHVSSSEFVKTFHCGCWPLRFMSSSTPCSALVKKHTHTRTHAHIHTHIYTYAYAFVEF